jgi:trehalose 6-phosphate synthase
MGSIDVKDLHAPCPPQLESPTQELGESGRITRQEAEAARLVVVSNRVADLSAGCQSGGLAVAMTEALRATGGLWFGWSGKTHKNAARSAPRLHRFDSILTATVDLTPAEHEHYYLGFANRCLWPLLHYRLGLTEIDAKSRRVYLAVNRRFAAELAPLLQPGDRIWVHDYHLIPLAEALRRHGVTNEIGFFLHTPFPPPEVFAAAPHYRRLARALFAYDLVGFQTKRDRENFARLVVEALKGQRLDQGRLSAFGQTVVASAFPIGIDPGWIAEAAARRANGSTLRRLRHALGQQSLIVGVDRLDYTKGLVEKFAAVEALLEAHAEHSGRVTMLQIAPPTREGVEAYDAVRGQLEAMAGRINGRFGDFTWVPVRYIHRSLSRDDLAGLFRHARVGLVTSLRDGMNLVAKEFVAAQDPADPGVLVLSCFAGAAEQLTEAVLVNPHDIHDVAAALHRALTMPLEERRARHDALWHKIASHNVERWRELFLERLGASAAARLDGGLRPDSAASKFRLTKHHPRPRPQAVPRSLPAPTQSPPEQARRDAVAAVLPPARPNGRGAPFRVSR